MAQGLLLLKYWAGINVMKFLLQSIWFARMSVSLSDMYFCLAVVHVWKTIVANTPKTRKEIMPVLMNTLISSLASSSSERIQVTGRSLGDLVRKLVERVLVLQGYAWRPMRMEASSGTPHLYNALPLRDNGGPSSVQDCVQSSDAVVLQGCARGGMDCTLVPPSVGVKSAEPVVLHCAGRPAPTSWLKRFCLKCISLAISDAAMTTEEAVDQAMGLALEVWEELCQRPAPRISP